MVSAADLLSAIVNGVLIGSIYSLVAMGLALIWGVMGVINFAHGDYMMLGGFIAFALYMAGVDPLVAVPVAFATIFLLGVATQRFIINRILDAPLVSQIAATFAVLLIIRYGAEAAFGPYTRLIKVSYAGTLYIGEIAVSIPQLIGFAFSVLIALFLYIFLNRTHVGIALQATSQNREAAQLLGINVTRMYELAFGIGVGIAAIAGVLLTTFYPLFPEEGAYFTLLAFIIVVLGGFGSVFGSYVSGIVIGVVQSVSALFIPPSLKDVVAFIVFILMVMFKPIGLFGKKE